ncbi:serine/threonine-protein kinase [Bordetella sp. 15P40C-2]|uniref:serine/threonine-protein kinase n=1 Tax=Bordetella sp. 15P40C-2 TaxID=2572246 RepID=UPI0013214ADE|nr:serine/threonine-protein kinase [Bordetella sp. 15P40C-2]MVW73430.1 hypothetical protein [Bordetella sp. 15P40C-2]
MDSSPGFHTARSPFVGAAPIAHRPLSAIAATQSGGVPQHRIERILVELMPVLDALHREGRICGDISVHSVGLDETGQAHLLALDIPRVRGEHGLTFTSGYAAFELFTESPDWPRGPWTDVYGLSAVVYSLVAGERPPPAEQRVIEDHYQPLSSLGLDRYSPDFLRAIDAGMSLHPLDRPQSIQAYAESLTMPLFARRPDTVGIPMDAPGTPAGTLVVQQSLHRNVWRTFILLGLLLLGAVAAAAYWWGRMGARSPSVITHSQRVDNAGKPAALSSVAATSASGGHGMGPYPATAAPQTDSATQRPATAASSDVPDVDLVASHITPDDRVQPPAKAERKTPALVKVSINVRPWGEIFIDGVSRGVTPPLKTVMLRPGTHAVTIRNSAQPPFHTTLVVKPGTPAVLSHTFR